MSIKDYVKACFFDFVLCLVLSVCLGFINCGAFYVAGAVHYNFLLIGGICAVLLLGCFIAAFNKRTALPGIGVMVAVLVVGTLIARVVSPDRSFGFFADTESSYVIFFVVIYLCTVLTFSATRKRWMCWIYYLACAIDVVWIQFMYEQFYIVPVIVLVAMAVVMVVFRNYRYNLSSTSTTQISFAGAFGVGIVFSAVVAGLACLIFFGLIAPMDPGALEFKPFTRYLNYETVEMTGVGEDRLVEDPEQTTDQTNEEEEDTSEDSDNEEVESQSQSALGMLASAFNAILNAVQDAVQRIQETFNYILEHPWTWPFAILLLIAILCSPYFIKKHLRKRRYERMSALEPREQVKAFWMFYMDRFKILKVTKGELSTLREFNRASAGALEPFSHNEGNVTFAQLTDSYAKAVYSDDDATADELRAFHTFYDSFYATFRKVGGKVKYILYFRFFRI